MDTRDRHEREREARRRLSAQRARAGFLRGRVIAASIICFGLFWAIVFLQMATGNDPVLSANSRTTAATQPEKRRGASTVTATSETVETRSEPEPETETAAPEVVEEPELEPVTTGQS